jgi:hypothetical protein
MIGGSSKFSNFKQCHDGDYWSENLRRAASSVYILRHMPRYIYFDNVTLSKYYGMVYTTSADVSIYPDRGGSSIRYTVLPIK